MNVESPKQALVYTRVSSRVQEREGTSLESQEEACVKHAQSLGYVVGRITKEVYSGAELWDRPLLSRDRADIRKGLYQALIVHATDRLSRDPIHLAILAQECEQYGVELIFVTEPLDNSDEGQLVRYIKGYSNKLEREKIRERSLRGKRSRTLQGKVFNVGPELYGYRRDKKAGVRVIYEPEAKVIRQIFVLVACHRHSMGSVAQVLNEQGVPTPGAERVAVYDSERKVTWGSKTVYRIVRDSTYKGEGYAWRYQRQPSARDRARPDFDPQRAKRFRPQEEWIPLPRETTPAIVSEELWQAAQDAIEAQCGNRTRNKKSWQYLLRGLVFCGTCGRKMWPNWRRKIAGNPTSPQVRVYRCSSYQLGGYCGGGPIYADVVEAWVWEQVVEALRNPERLAAELERRREEGPDEDLVHDLALAKKEAAKRLRQQERLMQRYTASDDESLWEIVEREVHRLEREKQSWLETITELEERLVEQQLAFDHLEALNAYCQQIAQTLEGFDFEQKRLTIEALNIRVTGNRQQWMLTGSIPLDDVEVVVRHTSPGSPRPPACGSCSASPPAGG